MSYFPNLNSMSGVVGSAGTPAINPEASDPRAQLQALLANNGQVPSAPAPSTVQNILQAIAQAGAVGLSNDPGAALGQQVAQQRQQQARQQEIEQARQFEMQMQNRQIQIQDLQNQIAEKRTIEAESRSEARAIARTDKDYERLKETETRNAGYDDAKSKREFEEQKKITEMGIEGNKEVATLNKQYQLDLENLKTTHEKEAKELELSASLGLYGVDDPNVANEIARKRVNGESLTPVESKIINKYYANINKEKAQKLAASRSGGGSGSRATDFNSIIKRQLIAKMATDIEDEKVELQGGQIVSIKNAPKDISGNIIGMVRRLTGEEGAQDSIQKYSKLLNAVDSGSLFKTQQAATNNVPNIDAKTNIYIEQFRSVLNPQDDSTYQAVLEGAKRLVQEHPGDREAIQNALMKTGVVSSKQFQSRQFVPNKATKLPPSPEKKTTTLDQQRLK